ncbi:hypothetical protein JTB14_032857 [Gonioctena quinquepunctata]|nr:hypothetical protein JTB14_032857 [Gonioctena quinquepunctata]
MHQFIVEYANKTLLQESAKAKEIENKDKLKNPEYEDLRKDFDIMKKSDKDDFAELIGEMEGSDTFKHLLYLTHKEAVKKGPNSTENDELANVIQKRHRDKVRTLKKSLRKIRNIINGEVKESYIEFDLDYEMEDEILDQMKTLDPELWGKYRISWENLNKRLRKDTKPTKEEGEKGEAYGLARGAGAPSLPPQETGKRAEMPGIFKGKSEKPNMKEYFEKRAEILKEAANKKGQKFDIEGKLRKERDAAKRAPPHRIRLRRRIFLSSFEYGKRRRIRARIREISGNRKNTGKNGRKQKNCPKPPENDPGRASRQIA